MLQTDNVVFYTLHLFAGAGGGLLADKYLGFRPIGAVEINPYCRRVLLQRQLDGSLPAFPVWDDVTTFRADNPDTREYIEQLRAVRDRLIICGGFPCQDISAAGRKAGITGKRSGLWREYARIIGEIRPAYVYVENSPYLIRRGADVVSADLSGMGYSVTWGIISAADVGARHIRRRFWGLAVRDVSNAAGARTQAGSNNKDALPAYARPAQLLQRIPDSLRKWTKDRLASSRARQELKRCNGRGKEADIIRQRRQAKPGLGRVAYGVPDWLDATLRGEYWRADELGLPRIVKHSNNRRQRLMAIGSAQVPLCAAVAFVKLLDILRRYNE